MRTTIIRFICSMVAFSLMFSICSTFAETDVSSKETWDKLSEKEKNKTIQSLLIESSWLTGNADGVIGKNSENAIIKYKYYMNNDDDATNDIRPIDASVTYNLYKSLLNKKQAYRVMNLQSSTYNIWKTVDSYEERGYVYDLFIESIKQYKELKKQGKTGTKAYKELTEQLIPDGYDESYIKTLDKYFTKDDKGCWAFAKDISKKDKKLIEYSEDGSYIYWTMYDDAKYFVPKVCIYSELDTFQTIALLGKMFDYQDEYIDSPFAHSWDSSITKSSKND